MPTRVVVLLLPLAFLLGACGTMSHQGMMAARVEPRPQVTPAPTATPGGLATVSFREDVRPLLLRSCAQCHGGQIGLYVDSYDTLMKGSSANTIVAPGDPENSILIGRLKGQIQPRMPLNGAPLTPREIATVETWIREGAPNN